jgi:hypothetical protein
MVHAVRGGEMEGEVEGGEFGVLLIVHKGCGGESGVGG